MRRIISLVSTLALLSLALLSVAGCVSRYDPEGGRVDAGVSRTDAGVPRTDAGAPRPDSGPPVPGTEGALRLAEGGRLEVFYGSEWGTICDDGFGSEEATVACRQLGFTGGTSDESVPAGTGPIWMDDIVCLGFEERLADCSFRGWGTHNCSHSEDIGVVCF